LDLVRTFNDHALAERLEMFAASDVRGLVESSSLLYPDAGAHFIEVAGGIAGFVGLGSPANGAVGLGFAGEVTHGQIAGVERFFLDRNEDAIISVCPLAHSSLGRVLANRGWTIGTFENVLVRAVGSTDDFELTSPGVEVEVAHGVQDLEDWALMAARGFSAPDNPTQAELRLAAAATRREGAHFLFGLVDGDYAGTGQLEMAGDMGWLSGDTTLPEYRRRGVQGALQRVRLAMVRDAGGVIAVTESVPGSASQRNMERLGFRVAYTRVDCRYPLMPRTDTSKGAE
jgi:GNAT superfamily N-acetyltransferase